MTYRKKLIEVALPLEAINKVSAHEKTISQGHPSTFHLWWSRKPLATCRAVLFASLVDDPSNYPEQYPSEEMQQQERLRLFRIIEELIKWDNTNNERVFDAARAEIFRSTDGNPPPVLDPFCGGGSILLEAQRLGLDPYGSDLNPVAVLITKALTEIPARFVGQVPVNPEARAKLSNETRWKGAQGLAEDVRYYGEWMSNEAERRIGHLYPTVRLQNQEGNKASVIAWLWVRAITCPNPACAAQVPLASKFWLSTKKGKLTWIEPQVDYSVRPPVVRFEVKSGDGLPPEGTVNRRGARCIACDSPVPLDYVKSEGIAGRMGSQLTAIVAEGKRGRVYLSPTLEHETVARQALAHNVPETNLPDQALGFRVQLYGMTKHRHLFTARQLCALTTFGDLATEIRELIQNDALASGMSNDVSLEDGGYGASAYADAVATYLGICVSRLANRSATLCFWDTGGEKIQQVFARQALPIVWDFAEGNPFSSSTGNFIGQVGYLTKALAMSPCTKPGSVVQADATAITYQNDFLVSTDPPYYDNIPYADLSDFFYVWLRRSLNKIYPDLFSTLLVPKAQELVADPFRHGNRDNARIFFEEGLGEAFKQIRKAGSLNYPTTIYYAFKQAETGSDENDKQDQPNLISTGWETMLTGLLQAGFVITGTWPLRTEQSGGLRVLGRNALASSIILVCRPRPADAPIATRREFQTELRRELPDALRMLQHGNIAPVDLAQAAIGPGMAVFSRYARVVESNGESMRVRTALQMINEALDEVLQEQEGEYDADTRWAVAWFEQYGATEGPFGVAETLSKAKNTSVGGMVEAGVVEARSGKVRLLRRDQLPEDWNPTSDKRRTIWEVTQHLIRALELHGENGAASLMAQVGSDAETARDLAYRLFTTCERKGWTQEALAYNSLVVAWSGIQLQSVNIERQPTQIGLL